jgi:hypothetical protein
VDTGLEESGAGERGREGGSAGRKEAAVSEHNLGLSGLWREFWRFAARFVVFFFLLVCVPEKNFCQLKKK